MKQYHDYLRFILENGVEKEDRTGTGTISIFGYQMRFDLSKGFPLVTTKKIHFKSIVYELLWFLRGDTNVQFLNDNGVKIWNEWALKESNIVDVGGGHGVIQNFKGDLGKIYGHQWRSWEKPLHKIDQISNVINQIKNNPDSRRLIVSAWNVSDLPDESLSPQENVKKGKMALAPCHVMFQFYTTELSLEERYSKYYHNKLKTKKARFKNAYENINYSHKYLDSINAPKRKLFCMLTQRSADSFLGVPYNIASYALLTHMIAQQCNFEVGDFIWSGGDCHIYLNHLEQVKLQLSREPLTLPTLKISRKPPSMFDYKYQDFELLNYNAHEHIKGVVAV